MSIYKWVGCTKDIQKDASKESVVLISATRCHYILRLSPPSSSSRDTKEKAVKGKGDTMVGHSELRWGRIKRIFAHCKYIFFIQNNLILDWNATKDEKSKDQKKFAGKTNHNLNT